MKKMLGRKIWGGSGKDEQLPDSMCSKLNGKVFLVGMRAQTLPNSKLMFFMLPEKHRNFNGYSGRDEWSSDGNRFLQNPGVCGVGILQRNSARVFLPGRPANGWARWLRQESRLPVITIYPVVWINCKQCGGNENLVGTCGEYVGNRGKKCECAGMSGVSWLTKVSTTRA